MDLKLKTQNLELLGQWWQHSQIFALLQRLTPWRNGSVLVKAEWMGFLSLVLMGTLPFLANNQIGGLLAAIALFWLLMWLSDRHDRLGTNWTPIHLPLGIYWGIATLATFLSPAKQAAVDGWVKLTIYFVLFLGLNRLFRKDNWRSLLVGTYLCTALAVCTYGLRQWFFGAEPLATWVDANSELVGTTRIYSFLNNPNLLAGYLLPTVPLGVAAMLHWRSWGMKTLAGGVAIAGGICVLLTFSRGGLIGLAIEVLLLAALLAYWWSQKLPKWALPTFAGGTVGLLALSFVVIPALRVRVLSIFSGREDSSNNFRMNVWTSVGKMIADRPILGIGPGNKAFNQIYPFYQRPGFSALGAYSVPLEITSETGFIGLFCYIWLIGVVFQQGWRHLNRLRTRLASEGLWVIGAMSAIAGLVSHGLVDTVWYRPQVQTLWWVAIALIASLCHPVAEREEAIDNSKKMDQ